MIEFSLPSFLPGPLDRLCADLARQERGAAPPDPIRPVRGSVLSLHILAVDDEPTIRDILRAFLERDGHIVETASDGLSGFEQFRTGKWDLVLVDRCMRGLNGCELAQAIKQLDPWMPVVMVSGTPVSVAEAGGPPSPIDAQVKKPFTMQALRAGMAAALRIKGPI